MIFKWEKTKNPDSDFKLDFVYTRSLKIPIWWWNRKWYSEAFRGGNAASVFYFERVRIVRYPANKGHYPEKTVVFYTRNVGCSEIMFATNMVKALLIDFARKVEKLVYKESSGEIEDYIEKYTFLEEHSIRNKRSSYLKKLLG